MALLYQVHVRQTARVALLPHLNLNHNHDDDLTKMAPPNDDSSTEEKPPTVEKSWETIMKKVDEIDNGLAEGWKEDIDTLLVFAGLFSAVVTGFSIEYLKKLSSDSGDETVELLKQISLQLSNTAAPSASPPSRFIPQTSDVRINTMWILSLILALVDALFCLVCKQWLREYRRPVKTTSPEELLALHRFRTESFELWRVPQILSVLPIMLEIALFLFFAGLLELLWMQHRITFFLAIVAVGGAVLFYFGTAILPTVDLIRQLFTIHPEAVREHYPRSYRGDDHIFIIPPMQHLCAYKSPQALVMLRSVSTFLRIPYIERTLVHLLEKKFLRKRGANKGDREYVDYKSSLAQNLYALTNWSAADLNLVQRFSRITWCPDMYALKAFRWIFEDFRDTPAMIPHLKNVLKGQSPLAVMAAVFERGMFEYSDDWKVDDVEKAVEGQTGWGWEDVPFGFSLAEIQLLYYHSWWITYGRVWGSPPFEWKEGFSRFSPLQLHAPVTRITGLFVRWNTSLGINFLENQVDLPEYTHPTSASLEALSECVDCFCSREEEERPSKDKFLQLISNLHEWITKIPSVYIPLVGAYKWLDSLDRLREIQNLPRIHFPRINSFFPISLERLNRKLLDNSPDAWVEDFKTVCSEDVNSWLHDLCHFIYTALSPIALSGGPSELENVDWLSISESLDWTHTLKVSREGLPLLTSEAGLTFLHFVNNLLGTKKREGNQFLPYAWVHILECVCRFNSKPLNDFRQIPMPPIKREEAGKFAPKYWVDFGGSFLLNPQSPADQVQASKDDTIPTPSSSSPATERRQSTSISLSFNEVPPLRLEEEHIPGNTMDQQIPPSNPSVPHASRDLSTLLATAEESEASEDNHPTLFIPSTSCPVPNKPYDNQTVVHDITSEDPTTPIELLEIVVARGSGEAETDRGQHQGVEDERTSTADIV